MSASKPLSVSCPPELLDGLSEDLVDALIASDFNLNDTLDAYLRSVEGKPSELWQAADYHAKVLVRIVLARCVHETALEQALTDKIRTRIRAVYG